MNKILFWLFAIIYNVITFPVMVLGFLYQVIIFEFVTGRDKSRKFIVLLSKFYQKLYGRKD
jgi:amino acid permease